MRSVVHDPTPSGQPVSLVAFFERLGNIAALTGVLVSSTGEAPAGVAWVEDLLIFFHALLFLICDLKLLGLN